MRPVFANALALTCNKDTSEVIIQFQHKYPESREAQNGVIETITHTADAASVVIHIRNAVELRDMLNQMFSDN